jgi:short-subunit dehydrogenase
MTLEPTRAPSKADELVLVTGGSRGIGRAIAAEFARHGYSLALVARDVDALRRAADELTRAHGVRVNIYAVDLAQKGAAERVCAAVAADGLSVKYLVNNAGGWSWGRLQDTDIDGLERLVDTNVLAPLRLTKALLPQLAAARGGVLFMSSLAALLPTPTFATYGASKAFLASLALGLHEECRAEGVLSCVVFPGVVRTGFTSPDAESLWYRLIARAPETVATASYRGFLSGQAVVVPGLLARILYLGVKVLPARVSQGIFNAATAYHR